MSDDRMVIVRGFGAALDAHMQKVLQAGAAMAGVFRKSTRTITLGYSFEHATGATRRFVSRAGWGFRRRGKRPVQPRGKTRTDFGARIERAHADWARGIRQAKGPVSAGDLLALNPDGTVSRARGAVVKP